MNQLDLDISIDAIDHLLSLPMPSKTVEEQKEKLLQLAIKVATVLALNVLVLIVVVIKDATLAGKLLLIEIMLVSSFICLAVTYYAAQIMDVLRALELIAELSRDQVFVELATVRENMHMLRTRFSHDEQVLHVSSALPGLLKSIGPLAMLLLKKETSAVQWGMVGWKVAQNAMAFFQERSRKPAP